MTDSRRSLKSAMRPNLECIHANFPWRPASLGIAFQIIGILEELPSLLPRIQSFGIIVSTMETRTRFFPNQRCTKAGFRLRGSELVQGTGRTRRAPGLRYLAGQALRHLQGQTVVNLHRRRFDFYGGWLETFPTGAAARARDSRHGAVRPAAPPNPVALRNVRRVNFF